MKKLVFFVLVVALLAFAVGCAPKEAVVEEEGAAQDVESISSGLGEISNGIDAAGGTASDLDTADLETLEEDLAVLEELELD